MAAADSVLIYPEVLRSIDSASFTGAYQALGLPFENPIRIMKFTNNSNVLVYISWDGFNDHEVLPPNSFVLLDVSANLELSGAFEASALEQIYARSSSMGTGIVYLSAYYGR